MFTVQIRDHVMFSHSLPRKSFGPGQQLHGATYLVDVAFMSKDLDDNNMVINMEEARNLVKSILDPINHQNLDQLHIFKGKLTTAEYIAYFIHQEIAKALASTFTGKIKVKLGASPLSWVCYEGKV